MATAFYSKLKLYYIANKFWLSTDNAYMKNSSMKINKEQLLQKYDA